MKATVDRIEGEMAVLRLGGQELTVHNRFLPENVREGDILTVSFVLDEKTREKQTTMVTGLLEKIFKKR
ncbi:MAG: DUF3006 domain-containing protein [bacterium]|nr:DUF3006 domain-containing protein [bacterium]